MFDRLDQLESRYEELSTQLSDPNIVSDQENYRKVSKAHRDLEPTVETFRTYRKLRDAIADAKTMLAEPDHDIKEMAQAELDDLNPKLAAVEEELKILLLPKIRMTTRTLSLSSAPAPVGTRPRSSSPRSSACTSASPNSISGRSKSSPRPTPTSAA